MSFITPTFGIPCRSNHEIFAPYNSGSPQDDLEKHVTSLGLSRLDFERCLVAGEVIYAIEGDWMPTNQEDEEARIGTLAYALKKLGNAEDAAEFMRCLNAICEDGDAISRQTVARYYYSELEKRGAGETLKEMALLAMHLSSLNPVEEIAENESEAVFDLRDASHSGYEVFDDEIVSITRMIRGRRRALRMPQDGYGEWLNDLVERGASALELDDMSAWVNALDQYDEGGAVMMMSAHERTISCGRVDPEITVEDLPAEARHLVGEVRRAYANGVEIEEIWDDVTAQLDVLFTVKGRTAEGGKFFSWANIELQRFVRDVLEAVLDNCYQDFHLTALRNNPAYHRFHKTIREAYDTRIVGEVMKEAYASRQSGEISVKHLTALKTAANLQRERLQTAPLSKTAFLLIKEVNAASQAKLGYLSWAFYGSNQPDHPIHSLSAQEKCRTWDVLKARKQSFAEAAAFNKTA
ncbi:MAG: hypothetical protein MOB07_17460 [Acidobacteria bacterium]|nr:hypothetical protein [Acidobacteriota bacterium]